MRELRGAGYDLSDLGAVLKGATDAAEKADALVEILAEFERRRAKYYGPDDALLAAQADRLPVSTEKCGLVSTPSEIIHWRPPPKFHRNRPAGAR